MHLKNDHIFQWEMCIPSRHSQYGRLDSQAPSSSVEARLAKSQSQLGCCTRLSHRGATSSIRRNTSQPDQACTSFLLMPGTLFFIEEFSMSRRHHNSLSHKSFPFTELHFRIPHISNDFVSTLKVVLLSLSPCLPPAVGFMLSLSWCKD